MSTTLPPESDAEASAVLIDEVAVEPGYSLFARVGAEAFGTFVLVLVGVGTALWSAVSGVAGSGLAVPLGFGIAVLGAASAVGHVSGGHFNPAVSLGAAIGGRIGWLDMLVYWLAQIVGGTAAAALLFFLIPSGLADITGSSNRAWFSSTSNGFGDHSPFSTAAQGAATFGLGAAIIIEVVATAVFVGVILGVTDKRANVTNAPVAIGFTLIALVALTVPFTNGSLNPARSLATALFSEGWAIQQVWVFWLAPLLGGAIAALVYRLVTPVPVIAGEWPETEITEEVVLAEESDPEPDALDALLARQAAAVPATEETPAVETPEVETPEQRDGEAPRA